MSLKRKASALPPASDAKKPKADGSITAFFGAPKIVSSTKKSSSSVQSSPSSSNTLSAGDAGSTQEKTTSVPYNPDPAPATWDKEAWVKTLTEDQKTLLALEIGTLDESWLKALRTEVTKPYFLDLKRFLVKEHAAGKQIFPPAEDVYSWSRHTPLNTVKAVVIGQDPYHNVNQAHGMCFSVRPPTYAPPSLVNIYKCLAKDYPSFKPPPNKGGLLTPWADRGVLLLNTCLTVRAHEANSHANHGWEKFTQAVIDLVAKRQRGVVFLAWGSPAGKRVKDVDRKKHEVLTSVHPSPLSAMRGWFDCGHFRKCNEWLEKRYGEGEGIDWDLSNADKAGV